MKLIIATGIYPPDIGGPATYSKKLAEELSKEGWDVIVLTYADKKLHPCPPLKGEGISECKMIQISRGHNVLARYFLYTWELVKLAKGADLIYAQGPVSEGLPALIASKLTGKKYVLKVVGDPAWERRESKKQKSKKTKKQKDGNCMPAEDSAQAGKLEIRNYDTVFIGIDEFQSMKKLPLKTMMLKWIERIVARNAYKIITPSEYLKKIVMMWGVEEGKIRVIYNAVERGGEEIKKLRNKEIRENENTPPVSPSQGGLTPLRGMDGDIILSAGRLVRWKGFDTLINIMPDLCKVNSNFKLVIVGDGPEYEKLVLSIKYKVLSEEFRNKEIKKLEIGNPPERTIRAGWKLGDVVYGYDNRIVLTGKLEHDDLMQLMRKVKIFVLNSGYEGLSHSVIEAMQAGLPCAVSRIGGNPELVEDGKTGLLFEYNDGAQIKEAVLKLWQDGELRERVIAGAQEKIGQFNFERMIGGTKEILEIKKLCVF